ncbi:uncharacterized protein J3R85_009142 [Psidium guajava]|nr:uncharacterized protein J3R85_009142 [Psidium guajava]
MGFTSALTAAALGTTTVRRRSPSSPSPDPPSRLRQPKPPQEPPAPPLQPVPRVRHLLLLPTPLAADAQHPPFFDLHSHLILPHPRQVRLENVRLRRLPPVDPRASELRDFPRQVRPGHRQGSRWGDRQSRKGSQMSREKGSKTLVLRPPKKSLGMSAIMGEAFDRVSSVVGRLTELSFGRNMEIDSKAIEVEGEVFIGGVVSGGFVMLTEKRERERERERGREPWKCLGKVHVREVEDEWRSISARGRNKERRLSNHLTDARHVWLFPLLIS